MLDQLDVATIEEIGPYLLADPPPAGTCDAWTSLGNAILPVMANGRIGTWRIGDTAGVSDVTLKEVERQLAGERERRPAGIVAELRDRASAIAARAALLEAGVADPDDEFVARVAAAGGGDAELVLLDDGTTLCVDPGLGPVRLLAR